MSRFPPRKLCQEVCNAASKSLQQWQHGNFDEANSSNAFLTPVQLLQPREPKFEKRLQEVVPLNRLLIALKTLSLELPLDPQLALPYHPHLDCLDFLHQSPPARSSWDLMPLARVHEA